MAPPRVLSLGNMALCSPLAVLLDLKCSATMGEGYLMKKKEEGELEPEDTQMPFGESLSVPKLSPMLPRFSGTGPLPIIWSWV